MRITEVAVRFHPATGGVETTVLELSRGLVRRGHQVTVVCADQPAGSPREVEGIPVVRLPYRLSLGGTHLAPGIAAAIVAGRPDVVHAHLPTAWWLDAAAGAAAKVGVPLIVTYNNDLVGPGLKGVVAAVYNRWPLQRALRRAARIVIPNPGYADLTPHLDRQRDRLVSIPWGVDAVRFAPAPMPEARPLRVAYLGLLDRHHGYKGLDDLLQAGALARRRGVDLVLEIGGAGPGLDAWRSRAERLGLGSASQFRGFIPAPALPAFFAACNVFVLPSRDWRQEGFGLVILEAMACGRPVLTTTVVGMARDLADCPGATLVPPHDVEALAAALADLAQAADLAARGEAARRLVESRFTWPKIAAAYESLFEESLEAHHLASQSG